jgi:multiple sugar transport system substrate-binding protein
MRMIARRGIMAAVGAAAAGLVLAACGAAPASPTTAPTRPTEPAKPAATTAPAAPATVPTTAPAAATTAPAAAKPAAGQVTEVLFWPTAEHPGLPEVFRKVVDNVVARNPDLKVTVAPRTYSNADEQKLITANAAQTGPDIFTHGGSSGGFWGSKGAVARLTDRLKASAFATDFPEAFLYPHTWKGEQYAIPWLAGPQFMIWRKDFFKEVGLDPEKGPATWEEQAMMGQRLAKWEGDKLTRVGLGIMSNAPHFWFGMYMHQNGGRWFSDDFKSTLITDKPGQEALEYVVDLFHTYKVNATVVTQPEVPGAPLLATGQCAMSWERAGAYNFAKQSRPDLLPQFGFGNPPRGAQGNGTIIFVDPILITAYSKKQEAAWKLLEGLQEIDHLEQLVAPSGSLVPRNSWYEKRADTLKGDGGKLAGVEAIKVAFKIHWGPDWTQYRIALIPFLEEAVLRKRTPKEALEAAKKKLDAEVLRGA